MLNWLRKIFQKDSNENIIYHSKPSNQTNSEKYSLTNQITNRSSDIVYKPSWTKPIFQSTFVWCLVGNIVDKHVFGETKESKTGTKQFSPGTKVYCFPPLWGDGYERIKVIGRPRKSSKFITVITKSKFIYNWRLQAVYHPYIIKAMMNKKVWTDKQEILNAIIKLQNIT